MNIIAGAAKGRRLQTLGGDATRPTSAKVRGALFNILRAWVPESTWLDLYAGSGAVSLEALSRGAARAVLVERSPAALAVIRENVALTKLEGAEVLGLDAFAAIRHLAGRRFDVVFMDPPYADDPLPVLEALAAADLLVDDGRIVVEHRCERKLPEIFDGWELRDTRAYADSSLTIYGRRPEAPAAEA